MCYTLPTQNEINGILVVPVKNPITGITYPAGTPSRPAPSIRSRPRSSAIYKPYHSPLPVTGVATTGLYQRLCQGSAFHRQRRQGRSSPGLPATTRFLVVPARQRSQGKRRQLSRDPAAARQHGQRQHPHPRSAGCARLYAPVRRQQGADARLGLSRTKAGKFTLSIGQNVFTIPGLTNSTNSRRPRRRPASGFHHQLHDLWTPEHQSPMAGSGAARSQGNFTWIKGSTRSSSAMSTSTSGWPSTTTIRSTVPGPTAAATAPAHRDAVQARLHRHQGRR